MLPYSFAVKACMAAAKIRSSLGYGDLTYHIASGRHSAVPVWYVHHGCRAGEAGGRPDAEHPAAAHIFHDQGRDLWHPDHGGHPVLGWYSGHLRGVGQLRHYDPEPVGGRHHGRKHRHHGYRSADPHGGHLRRQFAADSDAAQDLCAGGGFCRLHFYVFLRGPNARIWVRSCWVSASCSPV